MLDCQRYQNRKMQRQMDSQIAACTNDAEKQIWKELKEGGKGLLAERIAFCEHIQANGFPDGHTIVEFTTD